MGRLVQIEVENFKSYKGHQVIGPFYDFTSIIGPNGSGKSNLMDAISFVLGVHSSHLRSQSVKDMIYRASALNPSADNTTSRQAGPRKAHVTAVYETTNGDQILFKRTAHHTGQSDYSINNRSVSYNDYSTALEKESILVKAKNFLVFQGDVESVASQKPIELTKLVEQISGSWDYKEDYDRLKEQYNEAMDANAHALHKKRAVAVEAKQYRQQKQEAEQFTQLVQERQEMLARYLLWKLFHVEKKTNQIEQEINQRRATADGATEEQLEMEEKFKSVRKEQALVHRERTRRELQIKKTKRDLTEQRPAAITIQEKLDHLEKKIIQIKQNGLRAERDFEQQKHQVADLEKAMELLNAEEAKYKDEIAQYDQGPRLTPEQTTIYEELKQAVSARATQEQEQLANLQQKRKLIIQEKDRQQSKLDQLAESATQYTQERQDTMDHGQALTADAQSLENKLSSRQNELATLVKQRTEIHRREVQLNEQLQATLNELMEAKVGQHATEKETKTKESITMMQQLFSGAVHGPLSKLCRPTQRKYGLAVSTLLGRHLDAIVVDDQQTAINCIQYLREQRAGTATFLPLDSLSRPVIQDRWRQLPRASLAVDVIQCDHKYLTAVEYACGNTIVCDTMDAAKRICYEMDQDVKAVTLDGSVIHRSGLITGGPSSSQKTKIWDEKDVDGLMRTRDKILAELNELSRTKRMGSAEEQAKNDCDSLQNQLAVVKDEIKIAEQKLKDIDSSIQNIQDNKVIHEQQLGHTQHSLDTLGHEIDKVTSALAVVEDDIFSDFCHMINVPNIRHFESSPLPDQIREQTVKHRTQRLRLETQHSFETEQLATIQDRLSKLTQALHDAEQARQHQQTQLLTLDDTKSKLTNDLAVFEAQLQVQIDAELAKQTELDDIRLQLEEKGKDMDGYIKQLSMAETSIDKVQAERVAIFRRCKLEDIHLPLISGHMDDVLIDDATSSSIQQESSAMDSSSDAMDVDDMSQRSIRSTDWAVEVDFSALDEDEREDNSTQMEKRFQDDLKRREQEISKMDPNLKAIDRLDGVEQRLHDLEEEYRTTRKTVETIKTEFDQVKRKRLSLFQAAFTHISEHIDAVYKELTKTVTFPLGGTAYLTLEESHEPYLKGLLYHAIPPMKRFRDMDQLSGGEKSMAALALLFAIRSYQPSPFFVLDEVDAALDNTNVKRVVSYIRRHANSSFQFIVISFKNILYERAQSLVGIYRDVDHSSSKSLTLKLDEYEE